MSMSLTFLLLFRLPLLLLRLLFELQDFKSLASHPLAASPTITFNSYGDVAVILSFMLLHVIIPTGYDYLQVLKLSLARWLFRLDFSTLMF